MSNLIGKSLGRYHILEPLGEGGMAVVYKAFDTRLERNVAVKVILPGKSQNEKFLKRFEREAKALAALSHPNIIKVIDYGQEEGLPYLVMEYVPGGTLKQKLGGKPMEWMEALRLLLPIARALSAAHDARILHRDIKPSNILITATGDPMLSDFGIAKMLEAEETLDLTGFGAGVGTPEYMSPEQAGGGAVDERSDVYSLGVVLYEMLTGRRPYQADTPMAVVYKLASEPLPSPRMFKADLPDSIEELLLKALARNPNDRYKDMRAFAAGIEKRLTIQPIQPQPTSNYWKRIPKPAIIIAVVLLTLFALYFQFSGALTNRNPLVSDSPQGEVTSQPALVDDLPTTTLSALDCSKGQCVTTLSDRTIMPFTLAARTKWADTRLVVNEGDIVRISDLSGKWRTASTYDWVAGTNCAGTCIDCLMTAAPEGSLVVRIGDSQPYCAADGDIVAPGSGGIYLSFNDCPSETSCFIDNEGSLDFQLEVIQGEGASSKKPQDGPLLASENFEDGSVEIIGFSQDSGRWAVVDDRSQADNKVFQVDNFYESGNAGFAFGESNWKDYRVDYRQKILSPDSDFGIQVRLNPKGAYIFDIMGLEGAYTAYATQSEWVRFESKVLKLKIDEWQDIQVIVFGDLFEVRIDGDLWFQQRDARYPAGDVMIFAFPGAFVQLDDLRITELR